MPMKSIGFAGTAKNTGKTTAALAVLDACQSAGMLPALTSIGFDGENRDHITGLPKPRYTARPGTLIATTSECLKTSSARVRILESTGIRTVLGTVLIGEVEEPGTILLVGPNRSSDLTQVFQRFAAYGVDLTLVDGALNRLVPMSACDGVILSTGAAFNEDIETLAKHASALVTLMQRPLTTKNHYPMDRFTLRLAGQPAVHLPLGSLLGEDTLNLFLQAMHTPVEEMVIPGACRPDLLERLLQEKSAFFQNASLIFGSPLKLVASADPRRWEDLFSSSSIAAQVAFLSRLPVRFLTVNPFFPRYSPKTGEYIAGYLDKADLLKRMRAALPSLPVIDVRQPPLPDIPALLNSQPGG